VTGVLVDGYDLVILDLDGVIYLIDQPIPGAVETVERLRSAGTPVAYATNNASRRAPDVAALLTGMGVAATPDEVLTSAAASAKLLGERLPAGAPVLVVGAEALRAEVRDAGLTPVAKLEDKPAAVVQGYGPEVGWTHLAEASLSVRAGAYWMATNTDKTLPSERGPLPGNGWTATPTWWSASRRRRSSRPRRSRRRRTARSWWATASTPTSRAPWRPAWTDCWSSPASAGRPSCWPAPRNAVPPMWRRT
jgi:ribonucleotide monophosphatase NagD (HAD superfamily)